MTMTHAVVLIEAERNALSSLGGALADTEGAAQAYSGPGEWDVVSLARREPALTLPLPQPLQARPRRGRLRADRVPLRRRLAEVLLRGHPPEPPALRRHHRGGAAGLRAALRRRPRPALPAARDARA